MPAATRSFFKSSAVIHRFSPVWLLRNLVAFSVTFSHTQEFEARSTGRRPQVGPRTHWRDYTSGLGTPRGLPGGAGGGCLGFPAGPVGSDKLKIRWIDGWVWSQVRV